MLTRGVYLYLALLAVVGWYVLFETNRVLFGRHWLAYLVIDYWPLLMMAELAWHFRSPGIAMHTLGTLMNWSVVAMNGGRMPVNGVPVSSRLVAWDETTRMRWLSDWIVFWGGEASPGDVLMLIGHWCALLALLGALTPPQAGE